MSYLAELSGSEQLGITVVGALATATFVTLGAGWVLARSQRKWESRERSRAEEFQTRTALRDSYARLLVTQRQCREAALELSKLPLITAGRADDRDDSTSAASDLSHVTATRRARSSYTLFADDYHKLALDADLPMWLDLRCLEDTLKDMLAEAERGNQVRCNALRDEARDHRRQLEDSFRRRLGHETLHKDPTGSTRPDPASARASRGLQQDWRPPDP